MTIEASQYINELNTSFPRATDLLKEGDDHIRMIKANLKNTFTGFTGPTKISSALLNNIADNMSISTGGINFSNTVSISQGKVLNMNNNNIQNVKTPSATGDAVNMGYLFKEFLNKIYPVGSIYLTTGNEDPRNTIGGTWERKANAQYLIGAGAENVDGVNWSVGANTVGGSHGFVLAAANIPQHTHQMSHGHSASIAAAGNHNHTITMFSSGGGQHIGSGPNGNDYRTGTTSTSGNHTHGVTVNNFNGNTGGGNGLGAARLSYTPRFYVVQVWRRVTLA